MEKIFSKERHSGAASGGAWSENFMRVRVQQLVDEVVILVLKLRAVVCVYMVDELVIRILKLHAAVFNKFLKTSAPCKLHK